MQARLAPTGSPAVDTTPDATDLFLPEGYCAREHAVYFDDLSDVPESVTHQPDVYALAASLGRRFGSARIIDIGCGSAQKLLPLAEDFEVVGIDHPSTVQQLRRMRPRHRWLEHDLESSAFDAMTMTEFEAAIVICSDVIEHLLDPRPLLGLLRGASRRADAIVLSTPDRVLVRGPDDLGPPANPFHVREWRLEEVDALLRTEGLTPTFIGLTVNNDRDLQKRTVLAVIDQSLGVIHEPPQAFRAEAMYSCFNERDVVVQTVTHLLNEGVEVTVIDDWSTDGTWELLDDRFGESARVCLLRHGDQPKPTYEWASILEMKERLARSSNADWIIHHDADEVRSSPWPGTTLRTALWNVERRGFNAVDHTVIEFRPLRPGFAEHDDLSTFFTHFEWGRRSGHFAQVKAWRNTPQAVALASSAGHAVSFPGLRVAPYKFLLRHFPLRSPAQSQRKIEDRRSRFAPTEQDRGWHVQYDSIDATGPFLWSEDDLEAWDPEQFARRFLVERLSGIGIVR